MGSDGAHVWISLHRDLSTPPAEDKPTLQSVSPPSSSTQKKIPPVFQTLVDVLEKYRAKGIARPLRTAIGLDIIAKDKQVYERAGVKKFRQFVALAEKAEIITVGGADDAAWVSLHPDWCK